MSFFAYPYFAETNLSFFSQGLVKDWGGKLNRPLQEHELLALGRRRGPLPQAGLFFGSTVEKTHFLFIK